MREGTIKVFKAWQAGHKYKKAAPAIWTDGVNVFSYGVPIIEVDSTNPVKFNEEKYSHTTSTHQNGLRRLLDVNRIPYVIKKVA